MTVTAKDAAEKTVTNYVGSVQFSGGGTDAALPAAYAFVPGDNGTHTFSITMTSAGDQTISVADTVQTSVHGQASISVGAAGAAKLVFTTQPADAVAGSAFTTQPVVHALDTYGNLATDYTGSVSLAVTTGTGTLTGCPSANADGGVATFSDCEIDQAGEGHVLTATADGLSSADSAPLTVAPGAATKLVFTTQPDGGITGGTAFPKQPVVTVEDAHGNVVTDFGGTVSLAIKAGTGGAGSLSGCVAHLAGGVAKFTGCSVDKVGDGYVLTAAATGLASADSTAFDVGTGSPAAISVATGSGQSATVDTAFADSLVALVTDAGGNLVPGVTVTFTAPASGASGTFRGSDTTTATTGADGKATADVLTANTTAGDYNVTASVASRTATFRETNAPGAPAVVIKGAGDNQVTVIGNAFATALNVTVKDAHGNAVPSARVTFAAPGLGASGSFASTGCSGQPPATTCTVTTATNGTAATSLFTANGTAGGYAITATATGGSNPSASLALTNAPALSYGGNGSPTTWLSGGSKTAAYPSGTSPNDLLLLEVVGKGTTPSSTPPAGWTYLTSTAAGGNTVDLAVFWRLAGAETSVSFTPGDSAGSAWVVRYARGGGYPPNPVSAMTSAQSGTPGGNGSTTLTPTPLAATNAANAVEINLVAQASTATLSLSSQNNFTRQYTGAAGSAAFAVADRTVASPSTPTAPTWSSPTSARWVWSAVAFK